MLATVMDSIRTNNAKFARNVEYLKEAANDDIIDERVEVADTHFRRETIDELEEAANMVEKLSPEVDLVQESAEINRILNATENITFEEMIGLE